MALHKTITMLQRARAGGYGIGAFNVIGLEHAQAIVRASELENSPVILQISQNAVRYNLGSLDPIGKACHTLATHASVPVALHLDHATTRELCKQALDLEFGSVMFDASSLHLDANVKITAELADWVHRRGAALEAELGIVGGKEGAVSSEVGNTDPRQARQYVHRTGVDVLAVAVGTSHYMVEQNAQVDLDLIAALRAAVDVPLVLHGSSGVPDADLHEAVRRGITKVNVATGLNKAYTQAIRDVLSMDETVVDPRKYLAPARDAMVEAVRSRMLLLGSSGRA